ncbi:MAG: ATP-binding cassette domain-containing protein [Verrucomicrobiota bacterium]
MNAAFTFKHLSAGYAARTVLNDINFEVAEGEMVALLGPNGAGKSTLLRVLTGLHPPSAGKVRLFGQDVCRLAALDRFAPDRHGPGVRLTKH